jgi:flagellar basal-body rod protein FlgB
LGAKAKSQGIAFTVFCQLSFVGWSRHVPDIGSPAQKKHGRLSRLDAVPASCRSRNLVISKQIGPHRNLFAQLERELLIMKENVERSAVRAHRIRLATPCKRRICFMKSLFGSHIEVSAKVLDMRLERQNIVAGNLANIKTPGYKARRLEFESDLQAALGLDARGRMARTNTRHMPAAFNPDTFSADFIKELRPRVVQGEDAVDLDKEMTQMSKNTLLYNTLVTTLKRNFEGLKTVITAGGR